MRLAIVDDSFERDDLRYTLAVLVVPGGQWIDPYGGTFTEAERARLDAVARGDGSALLLAGVWIDRPRLVVLP